MAEHHSSGHMRQKGLTEDYEVLHRAFQGDSACLVLMLHSRNLLTPFTNSIAATMELVNGVNKFLECGRTDEASTIALKGAVEHLVILVSPFCPHITQELWQVLGHDELLVNRPWPSFDEAYTREETVTIAIQINGKLRDTVDVERDMEQVALKELILSLEKVQRHLMDREARKVIVVPNKLVNIVA